MLWRRSVRDFAAATCDVACDGNGPQSAFEATLVMATCPICISHAVALDKTGDADRFDCPEHAKFKVDSSVFADVSCRRSPGEVGIGIQQRKRQTNLGNGLS
jgi:hypothetical protein